MIPEITVDQLAEKLRSHDPFVLLDVREPWELSLARMSDPHLIVCPMSELSRSGVEALPEAARPKDAEVLVMCHHGVRSASVVGWLASQGWTRVFSVAGGIDEYARKLDPSLGTY